MNPRLPTLACLAALAGLPVSCSGTPSEMSDSPERAFAPPPTRRGDVVDDYHGETIPDPYRWLEDQDAKEVAQWVKSQNAVTHAYLNGAPGREALTERLTELWNYDRRSAPVKAGNRWLWFRNDGLQNQDVLMLGNTPNSPSADVVLDPNTMAKDGTTALGSIAPSKDGRYLAYSVSERGSDWQTWKVMDLRIKQTLTDSIPWCKFSGAAWSPDHSGFFYQRYPAPAAGEVYQAATEQPSLCYHKVGTDPSEDRVVYERPDEPSWGFSPYTTEDGHYLVITIWTGTDQRNRVAYVDLTNDDWTVVELLMRFDAEWDFLGNVGEVFYLRTNRDAPRGRIVSLDLGKYPSRSAIIFFDPTENDSNRSDPAENDLAQSDLAEGDPAEYDAPDVPEPLPPASPDIYINRVNESVDTLQSAALFGHQLVLTYLVDASHRVIVYDLPTQEELQAENDARAAAKAAAEAAARAAAEAETRTEPEPEIEPDAEAELIEEPIDVAALGLLQGRVLSLPGLGTVADLAGRQGDDTFYLTYTSFAQPATIYRSSLANLGLDPFFTPDLPIDPAEFTVEQVFMRAEDGTRVPMFLLHKADLQLDGSHPTYLYGYGGFNISLTPAFSVANLAWVEQGGVFAQATLRGGGEYGEEWHQAGMLENKQNVFEDFIACARYLTRNGYTSKDKLAIGGRSNGGLLAAACLVQRPELFGAAIPEVGVLDMLRYHKFTIGWAWAPEYGSSDDPNQFAYLRDYSPLHNIQAGTDYPPTMIMTGDHDDRVLPGHSYKFAAALQRAQGGSAPTLIRIDTSAGHGAGKPTTMRIKEAVDRWAFLNRALDVQGL